MFCAAIAATLLISTRLTSAQSNETNSGGLGGPQGDRVRHDPLVLAIHGLTT